MANFIVVDDLEIRHERFNNILKGHKVTNLFNVTEAIAFLHEAIVLENRAIIDGKVKILDTPVFRTIFLDHDIDSGVDQRDVIHFVKWIIDTRAVLNHLLRTGTNFFIHSHNVVGAKNMADALRDEGFSVIVKPFQG